MNPKSLSIKSQHLVLMANVKDAPNKCLQCKKVFISENHLKRHEDRRHHSKVPLIPSEQMKEGRIYETGNESTMKAVLNATERIEDLLVKLAIRENEKKTNIPMAYSSPRINFDDSLVTSSSFTMEKIEQNIENSDHLLNDSSSKKKHKEIAKLKYNEKSNFDDSMVISCSFAADKNIENYEYFSNDNTPIKKQEIAQLNYYERSILKDIPTTSNSFTNKKNEQNMETSEQILNGSTYNKKPKVISKFEKLQYCGRRSEFKDIPGTSNSLTNDKIEQNIENFENFLNDSTHNKKQKELPKLEYYEESNFKDTSLTFNSNTNVIKDKQSIENYENISNDSSYNKNQKEIVQLQYFGKSNLNDTLVTSNSFTNEKNEQNIENSKHFSNDSTFSSKQKEIAKLQHCEKSAFKDTQCTSNSFNNEICLQNIEKSEQFSNVSTYDKKLKEIPKLEYYEESNFKDTSVTSNSVTNVIKYKQNIENYGNISNDNISNKKQKKLVGMKSNDSYVEATPVTSNCFTTEKNELNIEKLEYFSNDSIFNKIHKKIAELKCNNRSSFNDPPATSNCFTTEKNKRIVVGTSHKKDREIDEYIHCEKSEFQDDPVTSFSFTTEKTKQNIENNEYVLNDSRSNKQQTEVIRFQSCERSNLKDTEVNSNSNSLTSEKNEQIVESCKYSSNISASNKKQMEIVDSIYSERCDLEDTQVTSDSFTEDKSEHYMESSGRISFDSVPIKKSREITKKTRNDFLEEQENKAIWRITSSIIKSSNYSLEVLDPVYSGNDRGNEKGDLIISHDSSFHEGSPMAKCRSSLKSEILRKLDNKLESYGVDSRQNTLSDKEMTRIKHLMQEERDRLAKEIPDYHKLRQLIKVNAHRRIDENLRAQSTYVS